MTEITSKIINEVYRKWEKDVSKYDHGMVIVIGGSKLYSGSPALSAFSAFRAGADMVHIIAPSRAADIAATFSPDLVTIPLAGDHLSSDHLSELLALTRSAEAVSRGNISVVIGGGMGRDEKTQRVIRDYLSEISIPTVIDADAIYAFEKEQIDFHEKDFVFTPHLYEFYILTGVEMGKLEEEEKRTVIMEKAKEISSTILLKGKVDLVSDGESVAENVMSVPYLTVGGTGDVLAGILGSLLARKVPPFKAAQAAAIINTMAGKLAAEEKKESLIATDVIEKIYKVIN